MPHDQSSNLTKTNVKLKNLTKSNHHAKLLAYPKSIKPLTRDIWYSIDGKEFYEPRMVLAEHIHLFRDVFLKDQVDPSLRILDRKTKRTLTVSKSKMLYLVEKYIVANFSKKMYDELKILSYEIFNNDKNYLRFQETLKRYRAYDDFDNVFDSLRYQICNLSPVVSANWDTLRLRMLKKHKIDINKKHEGYQEIKRKVFTNAWNERVFPFLHELFEDKRKFS